MFGRLGTYNLEREVLPPPLDSYTSLDRDVEYRNLGTCKRVEEHIPGIKKWGTVLHASFFFLPLAK